MCPDGAKAAAGGKVNLACCGIGNRGAEIIKELHSADCDGPYSVSDRFDRENELVWSGAPGIANMDKTKTHGVLFYVVFYVVSLNTNLIKASESVIKEEITKSHCLYIFKLLLELPSFA